VTQERRTKKTLRPTKRSRPLKGASCWDRPTLESLKRIFWLVDRKLFSSRLRKQRDHVHEERRLTSLKGKQDAQIILNYSRDPNSLLDALCDLHGTDKGGSPGQKNPYTWFSHSYSDFFSLLFEPFREQIDLVFECGLGINNERVPANMGARGVPGASLRKWRDYFPNAEIVGADIDKDILFDEERISTFRVDQTDPQSIRDMWRRIGKSGFQLMIDDGLHAFEAGRTLFLESVDHLAPNGTYIIENVSFGDMNRYMDFFGALHYQVKFVSLRRPDHNGRDLPLGDNQLVVIRRTKLS